MKDFGRIRVHEKNAGDNAFPIEHQKQKYAITILGCCLELSIDDLVEIGSNVSDAMKYIEDKEMSIFNIGKGK